MRGKKKQTDARSHKVVGIRIEIRLWSRVKAQALKEDRSVTKWVQRAIVSQLKEAESE